MGKLLLMIVRSQWDRTTAIVAAALSGVFLVIGWIGVASTSYPAEQTPYIVSGGITGILLMGIAATLWLSADMRDEWRKLDELSEQLRAAGIEPEQVPEIAPAPEVNVKVTELPGDVPEPVAARVSRPSRKAAVREQGT